MKTGVYSFTFHTKALITHWFVCGLAYTLILITVPDLPLIKLLIYSLYIDIKRENYNEERDKTMLLLTMTQQISGIYFVQLLEIRNGSVH